MGTTIINTAVVVETGGTASASIGKDGRICINLQGGLNYASILISDAEARTLANQLGAILVSRAPNVAQKVPA